MLLTCPDCMLECTIDEESVETANCPSCGLVLYSRSGQSGRPVHVAKAEREPTADELEETRQWKASLNEVLPTPEQLPRLIGRYKLTQLLGEGSFAQVYLAFDSQLGRDVALKIPRTNRFNSAEQLARFLDEARHVAKLEHPGIVRVYDIGWLSDEACFIAMEYCPGGSLDGLLKSEQISRVRAVDVIAAVADAIHHAHLKGFVHRDVKPSNIMFGSDGRPRLVDFGLAINDDQQANYAGEIAGTLPFMSPEQVRGDSHHLDGRTDIWSLGIILYQMLAGRRPFAGNRQQLSDQILSREPKPLRQIDDSIPIELELDCQKCLAKSVQDRWSTAADFAVSLRSYMEEVRRTSVTRATIQTEALASSTAAIKLRRLNNLLIAIVAVVLATGCGVILQAVISPQKIEPSNSMLAFSLDSLPLRKEFPLLEREPRKLLWFEDDPTCTLHFDPKSSLLTVGSRSEVLVDLGETTAAGYRLDGEFTKTAWTGNAGFFWGWLPDSANPQNSSCYVLFLNCQNANKPQPNFGIELKHLGLQPDRKGQLVVSSDFTFAGETIPAPNAVGGSLEVSIQASSLKSVRWNGVELEKLKTKFFEACKLVPQKVPSMSKGHFGIFNNHGTVSVRNAHFQVLKPNNKG